jgi:hypothetical protein
MKDALLGSQRWLPERPRDLVAELLSRDDGATLYVSGTVSNQARFYSRSDAVVLLSAPVDVLLRRIETRATNDYGKAADERALVLGHVAEVEPLLRATCTHEIDATQPIADVVARLAEIGGTNVSRLTRRVLSLEQLVTGRGHSSSHAATR